MNETEHIPTLPRQPLNKPISDSTDKCICCPQCGSASYTHKNYLGDGFRLCQQCRQEWWIDIKYNKYYQFNGIEVLNIELQELQQNDSLKTSIPPFQTKRNSSK